METFLWVEKYRPTTINDCILPDDLKKTFGIFVQDKDIPNMILSGGPGVGKTTVAKAMLDELTADFDESDIEMLAKPQKRFGNSIFNLMQSSFMPINEPNFDGSYILDFGDVLEVQTVGQNIDLARPKQIPIKRDGSINVPDIGKIFVAGLSLESASSLIKNKINLAFIGTEAFISLVNVLSLIHI